MSRGFARDYALDQLPRGYVWDLVDYIPRRRGREARRPWGLGLPHQHPACEPSLGRLHAPFRAGTNLLVASRHPLRCEPGHGPRLSLGPALSDRQAERGDAGRPRLVRGRDRGDEAEVRHPLRVGADGHPERERARSAPCSPPTRAASSLRATRPTPRGSTSPRRKTRTRPSTGRQLSGTRSRGSTPRVPSPASGR